MVERGVRSVRISTGLSSMSRHSELNLGEIWGRYGGEMGEIWGR